MDKSTEGNCAGKDGYHLAVSLPKIAVAGSSFGGIGHHCCLHFDLLSPQVVEASNLCCQGKSMVQATEKETASGECQR